MDIERERKRIARLLAGEPFDGPDLQANCREAGSEPRPCVEMSLDAADTSVRATITSELQRAESGGEVAQELRLRNDLESAEALPALIHLQDRFHQIIDVALRVNAARDG